jgi:hypothetical protein
VGRKSVNDLGSRTMAEHESIGFRCKLRFTSYLYFTLLNKAHYRTLSEDLVVNKITNRIIIINKI